jgi:hypothetical protein
MKIFGSKGAREERNRVMRALFIFKLTKCYTDNKIKKEKKVIKNLGEREEVHILY